MKKEVVKNQAAYNVTFNYNVVPANPVHSVVVLGDFNEWSLENGYVLAPNKNGDFEGKFKIPAGRDYHFRYLVNGNRWANEKDADRFESSPLHPHIDNSVLSLPAVEEKLVIVKEPAKKVAPKAEVPAKKAAAPKKETASKKEVAPKKETSTKQSKKKDDLTLIEGIGPKIAEILVASGLDSFTSLGAAKKTELVKILNSAGSRYAMHDPSTWAQQAKLAAAEKWDQLKKLQEELKGGKAK